MTISRNFFVSKDWISAWTNWVRDGGDTLPPINQKDLRKKLLRQKSEFADNADVDYYMVSQPLFYFLVMCFGGGPAIIKTSYALQD